MLHSITYWCRAPVWFLTYRTSTAPTNPIITRAKPQKLSLNKFQGARIKTRYLSVVRLCKLIRARANEQKIVCECDSRLPSIINTQTTKS